MDSHQRTPTPTLADAHRAMLQASAISDDVIRSRGYWTATEKAELAQLGFAERQQIIPALVIPRRSFKGEVVGHQIRPDNPRMNGDGKAVKYESPQGSQIRLDVPAGVPAKLKRSGFKLPLLITEGAKKVDAAVSAGMLAVGLLGVWTFKRKTGPVEVEILPDLVVLARYFENRQVVVGFDADAISNPNVYRAMKQIGEWIEYEGASALYLALPEVNGDHKAGIDDYLAAGGTVEKLWSEHVLAELPPRKSASPGRRLVLTRANEIKSERVRWLWPSRVPLRGMAVVAGEKGLGKSMLTNAHLVAQLTRGKLEGELKGRPVDVLVVTAEDDWRAVVKPRLIAHDADLDRVHRVEVEDGDGKTTMTLPDDVKLIEDEIKRLREEEGREVAMIVIDPIGSFLPASINSHGDAPVRRALAPLAAAADRQDVAVVVVMHLTKDDAKRLIHRVSGAGAFVNAARSVLAMMRDPEDPDGEQGFKRLIVHVATNWGKYAPTLAAHVESKVVKTDDGSDESTGLLVIDGESKFTVDDAQAARDEIDGDDVEDAIREALVERAEDGKESVLTLPSGAVKQKVSKELGCSLKTVQRAAMRLRDRGELGVVEGGFPRTTTWTLTEPDEQQDDAEPQSGHAPTPEGVLTGENDALEPDHASDSRNGVPTAVPIAQTRIAEPNSGPQLSNEDTSAASVPTGGHVPTVNGRNA